MGSTDDLEIGLSSGSHMEFRTNPAGNYLAHSLRMIHDDSKSIFPESVYKCSVAKDRRWKSTYRGDYLDLQDLKRKFELGENVKPKSAPARQGIPEDSPTRSMFNSWKVPDRITSSESCRTKVDPIPEDDFERTLSPKGPCMPTLQRSKTEFPMINGAVPRPPTRPISKSMPRPPTIQEGRVSAPLKKTRKIRSDELLDPYYQPVGQHKTAIELLQSSQDSDNFAVKKALELMANENNIHSNRDLQKWLLNASDKDRKVAMEFFESLTGSKLMGNTKEQKERADTIARLLKQGKKWPSEKQSTLRGVHHMDRDEGHLRFIRLLTPQTRANKWMHQTWHHLPNYRDDDPVNNRSAIYTEPNKLTPRHFVIHPDWG